MKKSRHSEEKIIAAVKQVEGGRKAAEIAREMGVSEATVYTWKSKYGGMQVSDAKRRQAAAATGGREPAVEGPGG